MLVAFIQDRSLQLGSLDFISIDKFEKSPIAFQNQEVKFVIAMFTLVFKIFGKNTVLNIWVFI